MPTAILNPTLSLPELEDPEQFVTVRRVPILDAHDDDPERGVVSERLLDRLALNSNARASRGDFPALILGHTRPKAHSEEIEQPPVVGYASGFHVADYQGRPCLHADLHINRRDAQYARSFPFRSVERLDAPHDFVDRIALLRTPPQRDLGVLRYARSESRNPPRRIIHCSPAPYPVKRSRPVSRVTYSQVHKIIGDYFGAHYELEEQRRRLEALREDGVLIPDEMIEAKASLPPDEFEREFKVVRHCYARSRPAPRMSAPSLSRGDFQRAVAYATREGVSFAEGVRAIRGR